MATPLELPTVAMDDIMHQNKDQTSFSIACQHLINAFETDGLAYLYFGERTIQSYREAVVPAFAMSRTFFSRPACEKAIATPKSLPLGVTRSYLPTTAEAGGDALEYKEAFSWSTDLPKVAAPSRNSFEHPNVWPFPSGERTVVPTKN